MIPELTNHIWQSTLFAAVAGLATLAFRKNRAQVRYWLWLSASVKFLVPFSLLMSFGNHLQWTPVAKKIAAPAVSTAMLQITQPFPNNPSSVPVAPGHAAWTPLAPLAMWLCGFTAIALLRARGWRRIRAAVRSSTPIDMLASMQVRSSPGLLEPGVVGLFRPILLLPAGIAERLEPAQLEAVLAHELCHVRRRDNLTSAIHMLVEALFWFHPLVWWIGARLVEERERACDEAVLTQGSEPHDYAEGILNVCRSYLESPLACASGVTGADLKKRIHTILAGRIGRDLTLAKKLTLLTGGIAVIGLPVLVGVIGAVHIRAQSPSVPDWQTAAGGKMAFEVASIKLAKPGTFTPITFFLDSGDAKPPGGRFSGSFPLAAYIGFAYKLDGPDIKAMSAQLPKWANQDYALDAKADGNPTKDQMRLMMQSLLADRFKLRAHFETKEGPVLALILVKPGKLGPKLIPHSKGPPCPDSFEMLNPLTTPPPPLPKAGDVFPPQCGTPAQTLATTEGTRIGARNTTMGSLAHDLYNYGPLIGAIDKPVIDQTGLEGRFDFTLELPAGMITLFPKPPNPDDPPPEPKGPLFLNAVREQLGLKLMRSRGEIRTLIIDHVERASEN
jgi:bla regulator protein BlaR1